MRGGSRDAFAILRRRRDVFGAHDLSDRIRDMATRLLVDCEPRRHEAAELRVIKAMTETELASSLQLLENHIVGQHRTCERAHLEMLHAKNTMYIAQRYMEQMEH